MSKSASIFIKLGGKVPLMALYKSQLINGQLRGHMEPGNAKNIDFWVKKWCIEMELF